MKFKELEKLYGEYKKIYSIKENIQYTPVSDEEKEELKNLMTEALLSFRRGSPYLFEKIKVWLSNRSVSQSMVNENDPFCDTMCTTGPELFWNPGFVKDILHKNMAFIKSIIVHECFHVLFNHHSRFAFVTDPIVWKKVVNVATDLAINQMIEKAGLPLPQDIKLISLKSPSIAPLNLPPNKDAMFYYNELIKNFKNLKQKQSTQQQNQQGQQGKQGQQGQGAQSNQQDKSGKEGKEGKTGDEKTDSKNKTDNSSNNGIRVFGYEPNDKGNQSNEKTEKSSNQNNQGKQGEAGKQGQGGTPSKDKQQAGQTGQTGQGKESGQEEQEEQSPNGQPKTDSGINPSIDELAFPEGWDKLVEDAEKGGEVKPNPNKAQTTEGAIKQAERENKELLKKVAGQMGKGLGGSLRDNFGIEYDANSLESKRALPWSEILQPFKDIMDSEKTYSKIPKRVIPTADQIRGMKQFENAIHSFIDYCKIDETEAPLRKGIGKPKVSELVFIVDVSGSMGTTWKTIFKQLYDIFKPDQIDISEDVFIRILIFADGLKQELIFRKKGKEGLSSITNQDISTVKSVKEGQYIPMSNIHPLPITPALIKTVNVQSGGGTSLYPVIKTLRGRIPAVKMAIIITDGQLFDTDKQIFTEYNGFEIVWLITGTPTKNFASINILPYLMSPTTKTYWLGEYDMDLY